MSVLIIRMPASTGEPVRWIRAGGDGALLDTGLTDGELPDASADRTIMLLPGEAVAGHSVHLPQAGEAQTRAAARFAVEDELGVDSASVHLAVAPAGEPGAPRLVAAIGRDALEEFLDQARALGAAPDAALPEWASVPAAPGEAAALIDGDLAHLAFGGAPLVWGFSAEPELAAILIGRALERHDCGRVHVWGAAEDLTPPEGWGGREIEAQPLAGARGAAAVLARGAVAAKLNLLQGEFAPRRARRLDIGPWRRAAVLACAVFAAWLGLVAAEANALNRRAAALNTEAESAFARAFPDEARIVNPRLQMQTRLGELRGSGGGAFLDLAAILVAAVDTHEGMEIGAMRYDRDDGALSAELLVNDYADLQALRDTVAARGGMMEEGASRQTGGRISGDVTVRLP